MAHTANGGSAGGNQKRCAATPGGWTGRLDLGIAACDNPAKKGRALKG
jgi:hypothetical protein